MSTEQVIKFTKDGNYFFNGKEYSKDVLASMISNGTLMKLLKNENQIAFSRDSEIQEEKAEYYDKLIFDTNLQTNFPHNRIVFGAPGTGKSFKINKDKNDLLAKGGEYERVTFHPDYSYANFVGTYKPTTSEGNSSIAILSEIRKPTDLTLDKFKQLSQNISSQTGKENGKEILMFLLGMKFSGIRNQEYFFDLLSNETDTVTLNKNMEISQDLKKFLNHNNQNEITYEYVPGPFMRMYVKALKNAQTKNPVPHLLIIEEINRANVSAVFGDIFQLLDRDDNNVSEYAIQVSEDVKKYLVKELGGETSEYGKIKIPNNMFIWASMNSADQGVFPMDTAFKRRWSFKNIGIDEGEETIQGLKVRLGKGEKELIVEWNELRKAINEELSSYNLNEDKLLGPFFLSLKTLKTDSDGFIDQDVFMDAFKSKIIMYLFEDAARHKRSNLFNTHDNTKYSRICSEFDSQGVNIFCENVCKRITGWKEDNK